MIQTEFSITVEIPAPPQLVWSVMADVERWPEWTASVSRVKRLSLGPLQVGSRMRIHQPKLPPALWRVIAINPDAGFTGISIAPGIRVTARHTLEPIATGTRVTLSIRYDGLTAPVPGPLDRRVERPLSRHGGQWFEVALHRTGDRVTLPFL